MTCRVVVIMLSYMAPNAPKRDQNGRLLPGGAGINPRGRPPTGFAFTEAIRVAAGSPGLLAELAHLALDVASGRGVCIDPQWQRECAEARRAGLPLPARPPAGEVMQPTIAEMQRALDFLAKYGGICTSTVNVELTASGPMTSAIDADAINELSDAEKDVLERVLMKRAGLLPAAPKKLVGG